MSPTHSTPFFNHVGKNNFSLEILQLYHNGFESTSFSVFKGILSQKSAQVCKTLFQNLLVIALLTCLHQAGANLVIL